jgi:hypothetical protein
MMTFFAVTGAVCWTLFGLGALWLTLAWINDIRIERAMLRNQDAEELAKARVRRERRAARVERHHSATVGLTDEEIRSIGI